MNKKFFGGVVFGLVLGIGVGISSPIIGATDILLNNKKPANTSSTSVTNVGASNDNAEMVKILKEINTSLKNNGDMEIKQNERIISALNDLNKKNSLLGQ